jgi:hypothetical protein
MKPQRNHYNRSREHDQQREKDVAGLAFGLQDSEKELPTKQKLKQDEDDESMASGDTCLSSSSFSDLEENEGRSMDAHPVMFESSKTDAFVKITLLVWDWLATCSWRPYVSWRCITSMCIFHNNNAQCFCEKDQGWTRNRTYRNNPHSKQ